MYKNWFGSFVVILIVAGLSYWALSEDKLPPDPGQIAACSVAPPRTFEARAKKLEQYVTGEIVESIDLSRTFEPTGDERALQILFDSLETAEFLPLPRVIDVEALQFPRLAAAKTFPEAGEEQSSPPDRLELLSRQVGNWVMGQCAALLSQMQPLKGTVQTDASDRP